MLRPSILFITNLELWSMGKGSGAASLYTTIQAYRQGGYQVYVITGNRANWDELQGAVTIRSFDSPLCRWLFTIKKIGFVAKVLWWLWFQIKVFLIALPLIKKKGIQLVYGYELVGVPVSYVLGKLFRIPVISRFQGSVLGVFIGKPLWQLRAWDHILALRAPTDLLIMTDDGQMGDATLKAVGAKPKKLLFWRNGVNKNMIIPNFPRDDFVRSLGLDPDCFMIVTVSRLHLWKRVDRMIQALPAIVSRHNHVQLVVVGDGEQRARLEQLTDELAVRNHVTFVGAIPQEEVKQYLNAADLFVSLFDSSNVGNPLLEAMRCGKCIITLNNGYTGRLIKHGQNGILLELDQLEKLADQVVMVIEVPSLGKQLGAAAKEYAEDNFWSWEERMKEELREIDLLVKGN